MNKDEKAMVATEMTEAKELSVSEALDVVQDASLTLEADNFIGTTVAIPFVAHGPELLVEGGSLSVFEDPNTPKTWDAQSHSPLAAAYTPVALALSYTPFVFPPTWVTNLQPVNAAQTSVLTLSGNVTAGPIIETHGLLVVAYTANGEALISDKVNPDGTFKLSVSTTYQGLLTVRVQDQGPEPDYRDEATKSEKDLTIDLRAILNVDVGGTYFVNVNPATELVLVKLGMPTGEEGNAILVTLQSAPEQVSETTTQVAMALGLKGVNLLQDTVIPIISASGEDNQAQANDYGRVLAALAGLEKANSTDTARVIESLVKELSATNSLSDEGKLMLVVGAANSGVEATALTAYSETLYTPSDSAASAEAVAIAKLSAYDGTGTPLVQADYAAANLTDVSAQNLASMNDVLRVFDGGASDTRAELQALVNGYNAVLSAAAGGTPPSKAELAVLGIDVSEGKLARVQTALAATNDSGSEVDTLLELKGKVLSALDNTVVVTNDTGVEGDRITNDALVQVTLALGSSLTLASGEKLQVSANGGTTWVDTTGSGTAWQTADNAVSLSASGIFTARIADTAGNVSAVSLSNANYLLGENSPPALATPTTATYTDTASDDSFIANTGTLAGVDRDSGQTLTYGITGGTVSGGTSTLAGTYGSLSVNTSTGAYTYTPNASAINALTANATDTFTVSVSDGNGGSNTATYTVNLTAANDTPTLTTPTAASYTDTSANDTFSNNTGTLVGADRDSGQTLTYGITGGTVSGGTSTLAGTHGSLSVNTSTGAYTYTPNNTAINALTANASDTFTVSVSDGHGGSNTATYTVNLTGANDTPTLITPTAASYTDTSANDTFSSNTGTLVVIDRDSGQTLTYGIIGGSVSGGTSTLAGIFGALSVNTATGGYTYTPSDSAINGLTSNIVRNFTVTVSDGSATAQAIFTVNLLDMTAPTVSGVAVTSATGVLNSTLNVGDVVSVTVSTSEAVVVTGTPQLELNIGGTAVLANYASGSNSTALVFTYTILSGQTDTDGISIGANKLTLNDGMLKDSAGNDLALNYALVADNTSYKVDTSVSSAPAGTHTVALSSDTGTAGDRITNDAAVQVTLTLGSSLTLAGDETLQVSANGGTTWVATTGAGTSWQTADNTVSLSASGSFTARIVDTAGNVSAVSLSNADYLIDENAIPSLATPTVASYTDTASADTFTANTGTLAGTDSDSGQTLTYGITGGTVSGGTSTLAGTYGSLSVNTATGAYTYTPNATAINALTANTTDTFTVTVNDGLATAQATYTVNLTAANDTPTLTPPTAASYTDNSTNNTFDNNTGTLVWADRDSGQTPTYGITGGSVSGGNSTLAGNYGSLSVNTATGGYTYTPNHSAINALTANASDTFTVTVSDGLATAQAIYTVNLTGANDTPMLTTPTAASYTDTSANDSFDNNTGTLAWADRDSGQTPTYGITGGSVSAGTSTLAGAYGALSVNTATGGYTYTPDATAINALTANATDTFTVTVSDGAGGSTTATYTVNLTGANDTPTLTTPTAASYTSANNTFNATTGTLAWADRDSGQTPTYGITGGSVSAGTSTLAGTYGALSVNTATGGYAYVPDATAINALTANATDTFTVTVSDGLATAQVTYTVSLTTENDTTAPAVASVAVTSATGVLNSTLNAGDVVSVTVSTSEAVVVTGTPQLELNIGGTAVQANYAASSSTSTALVFTYTILSGQTDTDGISIGANKLTLNDGTLKDSAGNDLTLSHVLVADSASFKVDTSVTSAPTGTHTVALSSDTGTAGDRITNDALVKVTLTLGSSLTLAGDEKLQVSADGGTTWVDTTGSGTSWQTADNAVSLSGSGNITARIVDTADNVSAVSLSSASYTLDQSVTSAPTGTHTVALSSDTGTAGDRITNDALVKVTLTLGSSLTLAGDEKLQVSADGGTTWVDTTGSGTSWQTADNAVSLSGSGNITARIVDTADNVSAVSLSSASYTLDQSVTSAPTGTHTVALSSDTGTAGDRITNDALVKVTLTLGSSLTLAGDEKLQVSADGGTTWVDTTGSGTSWQTADNAVSLSGSGNITARIVDTADNVSAVSLSSASYTLDTTSPSVTVSDTVANGASATEDVTYTFTFSEAVTGFDISDVTISTGSKGTFTTVSSTQYTLVVTPPASTVSGSYTLDVSAGAAVDAAGNTSTALATDTQHYIPASYKLTGTVGGVTITGWNLIKPVSVLVGSEWKNFYYLDTSGDGTAGPTVGSGSSPDYIKHTVLDDLFNAGNDTTDSARSATFNYSSINGDTSKTGSISVRLPTGPIASDNNKSLTDNQNYTNDLSEIWDTYNSSTSSWGVPPGWTSYTTSTIGSGAVSFWSSTIGSSADQHTALRFNTGLVRNAADTSDVWVALQVL